MKDAVDVVSFSGVKILGGPQAGLLVGRRGAIDELRKNALYRALRLDKVSLAGIEATLELMLDGRGAEIPARAMMLRTADSLRSDAEALAESLTAIEGVTAEVVAGESQPGSGSAPGVFLPTSVVRTRTSGKTADELAAALRRSDPPVFARIQDDAVLLDPRTLLAGDAERVAAAYRALP